MMRSRAKIQPTTDGGQDSAGHARNQSRIST
jgi:hypothetical protein